MFSKSSQQAERSRANHGSRKSLKLQSQSKKMRSKRSPFLFRYLESEDILRKKPRIASPERGGESNPIEEAPKPEPTKKGPYGD
jgi:hypothetical protein